MSDYTMDPDRIELLERRCARLERMIRILQWGNIDNRRRIAELEKSAAVAHNEGIRQQIAELDPCDPETPGHEDGLRSMLLDVQA